ncbi:hypothetical protein Hanom_Chr01g00033981 [Helianthus anomalus]
MQALIFLLVLVVCAANASAEYDRDDEYINGPRQQRQPLIIRQQVPATGIPVTTGPLDNRLSRTDAWSARMREKVHPFSFLFNKNVILSDPLLNKTQLPNHFCWYDPSTGLIHRSSPTIRMTQIGINKAPHQQQKIRVNVPPCKPNDRNIGCDILYMDGE